MHNSRSFEERLGTYSLRELEDIADTINQERFPERYNLVLDEIELRKSGKRTVITWEADGEESRL